MPFAVMVALFNLSSAEEPGMRLFMKAAKIFFPEDVPWSVSAVSPCWGNRIFRAGSS